MTPKRDTPKTPKAGAPNADRGAKRVNYLSLEFLAGRALQNAVLNLDLEDEAPEAIRGLGMVLEDVYEQEHDAGLGNGGLGRLAACYLDSLATRGFPACGYGIRYEYGMFRQEIRDGWQVECPDNWLFLGNPWETPRPQEIYPIGFGGHTEYQEDTAGTLRVVWHPADTVSALPHEMPIPGLRNGVANPLVLWGAVVSDSFNLSYFNHGDYLRAVEEKAVDETISKVLYPDDNTAAGKELRLKQQYFFVSASLQRILARFMADCGDLRQLPDREAVHLNDTHPVVAIPELMRLLMDVHGLGWDLAWDLTTRTCAYTNHTLMPEAPERWDAGLFQRLLPRHVEIIGEINRRFLDQVMVRWPGDWERVRRLSIFDEGDGIINADPSTAGLLRLVFLPNYGVSLAERIFPASDLSEQISTAGTEASGTDNMKFTLNGALTIGTMDGANIEICEAVGRENMFVFGLTEPEATRLKASGYDPRAHDQADPDLKRTIDLIRAGGVSPGEPGRFVGLMDGLLAHDPYLVMADFPAYMRARDAVGRCFVDEADWTRKSILNVARVGRFSSDRSVSDYAGAIWGLAPAP